MSTQGPLRPRRSLAHSLSNGARAAAACDPWRRLSDGRWFLHCFDERSKNVCWYSREKRATNACTKQEYARGNDERNCLQYRSAGPRFQNGNARVPTEKGGGAMKRQAKFTGGVILGLLMFTSIARGDET